MSSITNIGLSGLLAAQAGLGAASRNTANLLTPGYTRQGVLLTPSIFGGGVKLGAMIRFADNYKSQQLWSSNSTLGQYNASASYYQQLEQVMGLDEGSPKTGIDGFFGALDEASTDPTNSALRQQVISAADAMAKSYNRVRQAMLGQLDTARQQSMASAEQVNSLASSIADLNQQIEQAQAKGDAPSELLDQRDQLIDQLSSLADVQVLRQPSGAIDISLNQGPPLVNGGKASRMSVQANPDGSFAFELEAAGTTYPLDDRKLGGQLGGIAGYVRDTLQPQLEANKQVTREMAERINNQLAAGYGTDGAPGKPLFDYDDTTGAISVNPDITQAELGFSASATDPGNSDNLHAVADVRKQQITLPGFGDVALGDAYTMLVGKVGSDSQANQASLDNAGTIRQQAELDWQAVSGISMDEESVSISEYLNMYNANMKVISVANELFESTIQSL